MPEPITNALQTTLLVLYFVTPAATVQIKPTLQAKQDYERTKIWTLQSTSQITTENPYMCVANGKLLQEKFTQVSTATVRLYCLCPAQAVKDKDPNCEPEQKRSEKFFFKFLDQRAPAPPAAIIEIGPDTIPVAPGP
jgi:hypothetical protein